MRRFRAVDDCGYCDHAQGMHYPYAGWPGGCLVRVAISPGTCHCAAYRPPSLLTRIRRTLARRR